MEDLSDAISMMTIVKDNQQQQQKLPHEHQNSRQSSAQKPESDDEQQKMMKPDFKIGSFTNVYANQTNLGSLAALANYNNDQDLNETATEAMSSWNEQNSENMWDPFLGEKYNSEAYSEDRDVDGARRLLDFGDDYRAFIDSQSDNCSSLSAANIDSLSPPRPRRNLHALAQQNLSLSSNDNSMKMLKQKRIQELPETERKRITKDEGEFFMCEGDEPRSRRENR